MCPTWERPRHGRTRIFIYYSKMAKSKSGGTRTFIRGRVGSDVYSVGRDAKGKKQQVVRSLAESVANPQTQAQMKGRMIMSTIAQALAVLRPIVDHSFDNVVGARANLAEFTSRNYALIKADVAAHNASGNKFGLVGYQEKGAKQGCYVIAAGKANLPSALVLTQLTGAIVITLPADNITIGGLKSVLGLSNDEYFTFVGLDAAGSALYERFRVNPSLSDDTVIAAGNIDDIFAVEGNTNAAIAISGQALSITISAISMCCAVIISKKVNGAYIHNNATLGDGADFANTAAVALPTYPVGAENYLNGGDIFGMQESFNDGGDVPPTPSPTQSAIRGVTINGGALASTGSVTLNTGSNAAVISIQAGTDGASYGIAVVDPSAAVAGNTIAAGQQTAVAGSSVNLNITGVQGGTAKKIVLCRANLVTQVWGTLNMPAAEPEPQPSEGDIVSATWCGVNLTKGSDTEVRETHGTLVVNIKNPMTSAATHIVVTPEHKGVGQTLNPNEGDYAAFTAQAGANTNQYDYDNGDNGETAYIYLAQINDIGGTSQVSVVEVFGSFTNPGLDKD